MAFIFFSGKLLNTCEIYFHILLLEVEEYRFIYQLQYSCSDIVAVSLEVIITMALGRITPLTTVNEFSAVE